jgi:nucleoside-diphosphate-sugar epimerase
MAIGLTGENGFIGSHLMICAKRRYGHKVLCLGRPFSLGPNTLEGLDRVIHCAAVHRDNNPESIYDKNMEINQSLIHMLNSHNLAPDIVMLSSIQEGDGSPYGSSKKDGSALLSEFCKVKQTAFLKFNLNNTFGPLSQPYKYSFVATFCFNILNDIECNISDREITLSYIDDVVDSVLIGCDDNFPKYRTSVRYVFDKLMFFKNSHLSNHTIPQFGSRFDFLLYNTLVSFVNYPSIPTKFMDRP